jgi:DNA polymerase-1
MIQAHEVLSQLLFQYRQLNYYQKIDRLLSRVVYDMEKKGFKVDASILKAFELELDEGLAKAEQEVYACAGTEFNIGSPKQLSDILFTRMNIAPPRKSRSGGYSTSASVLEELQEQGHTIADHILEWRRLNKFKTTYTSTLIDQINPETGRVHSTFHLAHTSTGRFSSNEPNLQNIPIKDPLASRIRAAFIAPSGYKILSADYSQIELRLLAAMADVPALSNAFKIGQDIHAMTASEVFGIPADQITPDIRNKAKAINFGIIYGISGHGLARGLGISRFEATEYIKRYLERYSGIAKYMEEQKSIAREYGYVRTIMGRRCYVSDIDSKDFTQRGFAERAAINFPLQGSASDIMRKAMVVLPKALAGLDCKLILQVHDELIFEVKDEDVAESKNIIKRTMESIMDFDIPMVVSINEGDSWSTT